MHKLPNRAVACLLMVSSAFASAAILSADVSDTVAMASRTKITAQTPGAAPRAAEFGASLERAQTRTRSTGSADRGHTTGMLLGSLAIMALMARRRWNARDR